MADESWIKLYRKLTESLVFSNEKCLKIWIWCLCKAGYVDKEIIFGRQKIKLKKGQFIMGGIKAEETLRIARTTIYYWLNFLKDEGMIDIKKTNKYTIITIQNWDEYQNVDIKKTSNVTTDGQQMDTNKNIKNNKKHIYGEFKNVLLLDEEFQKLKDKYGDKHKWHIENLSEAIARKGYKYKSHYLTILKWDEKKETTQKSKLTIDEVYAEIGTVTPEIRKTKLLNNYEFVGDGYIRK